MSNWIHLNLWFNNNVEAVKIEFHKEAGRDKPSGKYGELIFYLKHVVDSLTNRLIGRYFYLFEPDPHIFLALEVKNDADLSLIQQKLETIERPNFIERWEITPNSGDESNGDVAIDFFHAATKFAFFRVSDDYKPGYGNNDETKLVHCFSNQLFFDWENEKIFYLNCLRHRGCAVELKEGRIA